MAERVGKRIDPSMRDRRVDLYAVLSQKLFERISRRSEEINVTTLTSELENRFVALPELCRGYNCDLMVTLDSFGEEDELGRSDQASQFGVGRYMQVCLEWDVFLMISW